MAFANNYANTIESLLVDQKSLSHLCGKSLEPNGRPISRSHSFKSNRNTATQLCLKLYWHAVFHTQEHATSSNGPTINDRGALGAGLTSSTPYTHSVLVRKTKLRAPPSCGRAFKTSQPVLHECVNQQFLQSNQQISRTTTIAHSTCLWARIPRPGCSVNNPGNLLKTKLPSQGHSFWVFCVFCRTFQSSEFLSATAHQSGACSGSGTSGSESNCREGLHGVVGEGERLRRDTPTQHAAQVV